MPTLPTSLHALYSRRTILVGLAALTTASPQVMASDKIGLIMVDEPGCSYCRKFDAEIGGSYNRTAQGRFAPLVKVRRKARELSGFNPVIYTPTFILVRRNEELGRITGYPGAEYFYSELDGLLAKVGFAPGFMQSQSGART